MGLLKRMKICKHKGTNFERRCQCDAIVNLISNGSIYEKYAEYIKILNEMEEDRVIELYAGDSYLNDIQEHCKKEDRYSISHYYRCKRCKRVFFIGICFRGSFIFKVDEFPKSYARTIEDINFEKTMNGKEKLGVRFNNKQRFR